MNDERADKGTFLTMALKRQACRSGALIHHILQPLRFHYNDPVVHQPQLLPLLSRKYALTEL